MQVGDVVNNMWDSYQIKYLVTRTYPDQVIILEMSNKHHYSTLVDIKYINLYTDIMADE